MTFLKPIFLLGLSLVAVPIIIHLWFQRRLKKIPFSNLQLLKKSEAKKFGFLHVREILVLLFRCLFVIFFFLGLAKPRLENRLFKTGRLASVFLIIDNSYSMAYGDNNKLTKQMVEKMVNFYTPNSEFCILSLGSSTQYEKQSWVTRKFVPEIVGKIPLSYKGGSIDKVLLNQPGRKPKYPVEYLYIGDGQEANFEDFPDYITKDDHFYWLKIPTGNNVGITGVRLKDPLAGNSDNYLLVVELTNFSSKTWSGKAGVGAGKYYFEKKCELQPKQILNLEFLLPITINKGKVEIYYDSLNVDNSYYFSKSLLRELKVLLVGHNEFLQAALKPGVLQTPFSVETVNNLKGVDLRSFNIVILNGLNEISESDKIKLEDFLMREDTGILCFLGDEIGGNLVKLIGRGIHPGKQILPRGYVTMRWIDYEHPVFKVFFGNTALHNIKIYRFWEVITDKEKEIIAKLDGGYPLIIIRDNLALVTTQPLPQYTDLIYKATFVPLLYRLIVYLILPVENTEFYVSDKIKTMNQLKAPTGEYQGLNNEFLVPGFYMSDKETIGVNVRPDEGNLKILGEERAKVLNIKMVKLNELFIGSDLSNIFLYLALSAVLLELILLLV